MHAIAAYQSTYAPPEKLAQAASHMEIGILGEPIGRQDQYASAHGGLNVIEFGAEGQVRVEKLTLSRELNRRLDRNLLMFYTGDQRATRTILSDQSKGVADDDAKFDATRQMVGLVYEMRDALYRGDLDAFGDLLHRNWLLKRSLSKHISNPRIDDAYQRALDAGARGGKLCGAGGGGFLLLYCEHEHQPALRQALSDLTELVFRFDHGGSRIIFHDGHGTGAAHGFLARYR